MRKTNSLAIIYLFTAIFSLLSSVQVDGCLLRASQPASASEQMPSPPAHEQGNGAWAPLKKLSF